MTQQQFNDGFWQLDDAALKGAFVGYSVDDAPMQRDDLASVQLVSAGDGIYFLNWPGAGLARQADGSPFVLDYAKAVQASRDRALQQVLATQEGRAPGQKPNPSDELPVPAGVAMPPPAAPAAPEPTVNPIMDIKPISEW
jgi:hypothetical protein